MRDLAERVCALANTWATEHGARGGRDAALRVRWARDVVLEAFGQLAAADGCVRVVVSTAPGDGAPAVPTEAL